MDVLLDTCSFLWLIFDDDALSQEAIDTFLDPQNVVFLSSASSWEISVKFELGKLSLPEKPEILVPKFRELHSIETLSISESATFNLSKLPNRHKDPFDRILICQAIEHSLSILTPDQLIQQYPIRTIW